MKTTIYLPDDIKTALGRRAAVERRSEADIIREALQESMRGYLAAPMPRLLPVAPGPVTHLAEHVDELLEGFGGR